MRPEIASQISTMREIFRLALPQIPQDAEIVLVHSTPWIAPDGERISLERYETPGSFGGRFIFSIAFVPEWKKVFALRISPEELVSHYEGLPVPEEYLDYLRENEYYIICDVGSSSRLLPPSPSL